MAHSIEHPYPSQFNASTNDTPVTKSNFDTNIIIITAALLFVLILALATNALIQCIHWYTIPSQLHATTNPRPTNIGIKREELNLLPSVIFHGQSTHDGGNYMEYDFTQCPICLSDFKEEEKIRVLPMCGHSFHIKCVDRWLSQHSSCPTCRGDLAPTLMLSSLDRTRRTSQVELQIVISSVEHNVTPLVYRVSSMTLSGGGQQHSTIVSLAQPPSSNADINNVTQRSTTVPLA